MPQKLNMEYGKWSWFYNNLFFYSNGISCFMLNITIVKGPRLTTPSPSSYGVSCFLLETVMGLAKIHPLSPKYPPSIWTSFQIPSQWTCSMLIRNMLYMKTWNRTMNDLKTLDHFHPKQPEILFTIIRWKKLVQILREISRPLYFFSLGLKTFV